MKGARLIYISVYLNILSKAGASTVPSIGNATLTMDWRGRALEREVKLHLVGATSNLYHGLGGRTRERELNFHIFSNMSA